MGGYSNPLVDSGWNSPNAAPFNPSPIQIGTPGQGAFGQSGATFGNPGGYGNPRGNREIERNLGLSNIVAAQMKNQLAPQWAKLMGQYGQNAGNFFQNLMNFGSPFYKQKQTEAFNQGVQQNQNAMGQAQQQLRSQGYGSTPSGANAAMIGGMNQQGSQNLAEQYLQNLFQNEQMQLGGAQGEAGVAQMFNPQPLLSGTGLGTGLTPTSSFFQNFHDIMSGIGSAMGGYGSTSLPGA